MKADQLKEFLENMSAETMQQMKESGVKFYTTIVGKSEGIYVPTGWMLIETVCNPEGSPLCYGYRKTGIIQDAIAHRNYQLIVDMQEQTRTTTATTATTPTKNNDDNRNIMKPSKYYESI